MNTPGCLIAELPNDLQVLVWDLAGDFLGPQGLKRVEAHRFAIHRVPVNAFPRVRMWTDYRNREYSEAMIGREVPPVLVCGGLWLDGRNRVWAARQSGRSEVDCIDLSEIGLRVRCGGLAKLRRNWLKYIFR